MALVNFMFAMTLAIRLLSMVSATGSCGPDSPFVGTIKHYTAGLGSCGLTHDGQTEYIVGMSHLLMGGVSNGNPNCGMPIRVCIGVKCIDATIEDKCMGCDADTWDVSEALFRDLVGDLNIGKATVNYSLGAPVIAPLISSSTPSATLTMVFSTSNAAPLTSNAVPSTSNAVPSTSNAVPSTSSAAASTSNATPSKLLITYSTKSVASTISTIPSISMTSAITQTSVISNSDLAFTRPAVTGLSNITAAPYVNSTAGAPFRNVTLPSIGIVQAPFAFSGARGVPRPTSRVALMIATLGGMASIMI